GTADVTKTGTGSNNGVGGNVFSGVSSFTNTGTGYLLMAFTNGDTYNDDVTFTNTGTSYLRIAYAGANIFNGNIQVNNTSGTGIFFDQTTGTSTLANTKTISLGGLGFTTGTLSLPKFTQTGGTA